ncbi:MULTISPECIES: hypothetical protein [unclassified Aeromicrobium]|uniref:hypothetical protein n=1 Tax=unclassified Aeromicrobium TaxID=2633570 RepID=UPI002889B5CD|nr:MULTISPECIES: hypothetical protein [unclassified Aeromicrobium]
MRCSDCYGARVLADPVAAADLDPDYAGPDMGDGIPFCPGTCVDCGATCIVFGEDETVAARIAASTEYAEGYEAGKRSTMLGMLVHLCEELHAATIAAGHEQGARA